MVEQHDSSLKYWFLTGGFVDKDFHFLTKGEFEGLTAMKSRQKLTT